MASDLRHVKSLEIEEVLENIQVNLEKIFDAIKIRRCKIDKL